MVLIQMARWIVGDAAAVVDVGPLLRVFFDFIGAYAPIEPAVVSRLNASLRDPPPVLRGMAQGTADASENIVTYCEHPVCGGTHTHPRLGESTADGRGHGLRAVVIVIIVVVVARVIHTAAKNMILNGVGNTRRAHHLVLIILSSVAYVTRIIPAKVGIGGTIIDCASIGLLYSWGGRWWSGSLVKLFSIPQAHLWLHFPHSLAAAAAGWRLKLPWGGNGGQSCRYAFTPPDAPPPSFSRVSAILWSHLMACFIALMYRRRRWEKYRRQTECRERAK